MEHRAQIEQRTESERRNHEWRMMFAEKGMFAVVVGLIMAVATVCGNMFVERYKSDASFQQARVQIVRAASNEVWKKLTLFEASVEQFDEVIQTQQFNKHFGFLKNKNAPKSDLKNVNHVSDETKKALSSLWETLQTQELNLGPNVYAVFFRAMQDIAVLRNIYESQARRDGESDKIDNDAIKETRLDLKKQKQLLSFIMDQQ
jgi:hypothetical protein